MVNEFYCVRKRNTDSSTHWSSIGSDGGRRHLKVLKPVEEVLTDAIIRRFLLLAGFRNSSKRAEQRTREFFCEFLRKLVQSMVIIMQYDRRLDLQLIDVMRTCRFYGIRIYGYDDMCILTSKHREESLHVTELVENKSTFCDSERWDEPDCEPPGAYFKKTNFVQNYAAWENDEEESEGEVSEWSWFGDSDDDDEDSSDGYDENEDIVVDLESDNASTNQESEATLRPWQQDENENTFVKSLEQAQVMADEHLAFQDSKQEEMDWEETPQGQGYYSDYDEVHEPSCADIANKQAQWLENFWDTSDDIHNTNTYNPSDHNKFHCYSDGNHYIMTRQEFYSVFRSTLNHTLNISSVALSALHNTAEQYLHRALCEGTLHFQLASELMQEYISSTHEQQSQQLVEAQNLTSKLQTELKKHKKKVNEQDKIICDLKSAFKAKELAMQKEIAELKRKLEDRPVDKENVSPNRRKSPRKRTATNRLTDAVRKESPTLSKTTNSVVGSLRSRRQNHANHKKTKLNPI